MHGHYAAHDLLLHQLFVVINVKYYILLSFLKPFYHVLFMKFELGVVLHCFTSPTPALAISIDRLRIKS
jgi:hypothetical protein